MGVKQNFGHSIESIVRPFGRGFARLGVSPNMLTTTGLLLTGVAAWLVATDHPVAAGWVLVFGGLMDTFDGATARFSGRSTPFGAFYDAVSDRISDGVILSAVAYWVRDDATLFLLAVLALTMAQVTSYIRARAEAIDLSCSVGVMERAERAVLLMVALVFNRWVFEPILWVLAIGATVTVVQRIHHVWCQTDRDVPDELFELLRGDRAWSPAFMRAARRFFGERNFDRSLEEYRQESTPGTTPGTAAQ